MNKQQLAAKIWESTNQMRSKIEANEYKDYILGFIFYKYLSDQLLSFAKAQGMSEDEIKALSEDDPDTVAYIKKSWATLSPIMIYSPHGWMQAVILMFPMCAMFCLLLAV